MAPESKKPKQPSPTTNPSPTSDSLPIGGQAAVPPNAPGGTSPVLDSSQGGGPFIPAQSGAAGVFGGADGGQAPTNPNEELIVEVEFTPGTAALGAALTANTAAFLTGAAFGTAPPNSALPDILRQYNLRRARPVHTAQRIQEDEAHTNSLRQAVALGAASPEQVSARERLPSLAQFIRLYFPPGTPSAEVTAALRRLPEVARAVPVPAAAPPMPGPAPADPLVGTGMPPLTADPVSRLESQWYLHRTRTPPAWRVARGQKVVVADIDWGFRLTHQEFAGAIERTYNAVDGSTNVTHGASTGHGTAVLGIAGARANGVGIAGYAPEATLWAVQGNSAPGPPQFEEPWAEAIDFVRRTDAGDHRKVIILEVQTINGGNYEQVPSVHRAIRAAIADGCVVCVAAGNGNRPVDRSDAGDPFDPTGSILVGATAYDDRVNKRAFFSNHGNRIVVSAPGDLNHDLTCGLTSDNAYKNDFGGTSGATPKVAGAVALMLSVNPKLTHVDVRGILTGTGAPLTEDPGKPVGVFLNTEAAVAEALRRRIEADPFEALPDLVPGLAWTKSILKGFHGVRRRKSQTALPKEESGATSLDDVEDTTDGGIEDRPGAPGERLPVSGDKPLRLFRESVGGTLTQDDRLLIVEQAIQMLDSFYVHRKLKEAMHAVRPIQRLRVLLRRLQPGARGRWADGNQPSELTFHNTITQIFNSVRDLHTGYQLPSPFRDYIAFLPFEAAPFYEGNRRRYLVTRVVPGYVFEEASFGPGVELLYWNGMSIDRAVRTNADQTAGSNEAARHARGVSALTIRPMNTALPPDADFVQLEFVPKGMDADQPSSRRQMRQSWFVRFTSALSGRVEPAASAQPSAAAPVVVPQAPPAISFAAPHSMDIARESTARSSAIIFGPTVAPPLPPVPTAPNVAAVATNLGLNAVLGIDTAADAVREARQLIFETSALRSLQRVNPGDEAEGIRGSASPASVDDASVASEITVTVPWNAAFRARKVTIDGVEYGHIHIRTFYVTDADGFVQEFIRLLTQIPSTGLILDVRGNGGGNIWAAERLLQTLTAAQIEPERMQFIVSAGTLDLCRNNPATSQIPLDPWLTSLEDGVETGSIYSQAFPLTTKESCNAIGQQYYSPVVLIVDGNCYSATDIFAAGFQDHGIGKVLGVSDATGAGGANVWDHWLLNQALPSGWGLKPLPSQAGMRVAIRQCLRVGRQSGSLLEDFGVVPDEVHLPTREDVLEGDRKLLARAAKHLAVEASRSISVTVGSRTPEGQVALTIRTRNLRRLDYFIDDRPYGTHDLNLTPTDEATENVSVRPGSNLRLLGYSKAEDRKPSALYQKQVS